MGKDSLIKEAEKFLDIALGGNMNISTLTPYAWYGIMADFARHVSQHYGKLWDVDELWVSEVIELNMEVHNYSDIISPAQDAEDGI